MSTRTSHLAERFLRTSQRVPDRLAVEVAGKGVSYRELREQAKALAGTLLQATSEDGPPLTAVFAHRSVTAYAGVLAALLRGHGYVPLNRTFPPDRTRTMLERSGCQAMIVDSESAGQLDVALEGLRDSLVVVLPTQSETAGLAARWPMHRFIGANAIAAPAAWSEQPVSGDAIAYLLFTSGSTGIPKGVMVAQRNVTHFVDVMVSRYEVNENDRFSQMFDMTFDLSAFDMFVAWDCGACVCCPSQKTLLNPARFIQESRLTVWFSVPSVGLFMKRLGALKPGQFPALRWSLFCGEALPAELAAAWALAASNSVVENLYGPTELTIACTLYRWDPRTSPPECELGLVPIGRPYPGMEELIADEALQEVGQGEEGELLVSGPQLSLGYWKDPEKTAAAFVTPPGKGTTYYRTGDRVRRPAANGPLVYLGRLDHQVKIMGHRVELGEIEAHLRRETGADLAVALGWPVTPSGSGGIVAFLAGRDVDAQWLRSRLQSKLPDYAVPREIKVLPEFPLNASGKVDRKALLRMLEERE